jgi:hypothetical protein
VGSMGDALRGGRARDPRAARLDFAVVGARRLLLLQAGARLLDAGGLDGGARRRSQPRPDARWRRAPGVGDSPPERAPRDRCALRPLRRRRARLRAPRRAPGRARPRHVPVLVDARAPVDDRHAVRRRDVGGDGHAPRRARDARRRRGPELHAPRARGRAPRLAVARVHGGHRPPRASAGAVSARGTSI